MTTQPIVHLVTDDEVKGKAKEIYKQLTEKTGKVPKWVKVMANCDDILVGFFTMFKATMDDSPLDSKLKWKVAYKISDVNKCEFCVSVAEFQLKSMGISEEDLRGIDQSLNDRENLAVEYALQATKHAYKLDAELVERVKKEFTDEELVELTAVVGLFNYINRFNDALGVLPEA